MSAFGVGRATLAFMAASIVVPILANGVRAFATIYVDYNDGGRHIALTMCSMAGFLCACDGIGDGGEWRFFDRKPAIHGCRSRYRAIGRMSPLHGAGAVAAILVALAQLAGRLSAPLGVCADARGHLVAQSPDGSRSKASGLTPWRPHYEGADQFLAGQYRNAAAVSSISSSCFMPGRARGARWLAMVKVRQALTTTPGSGPRMVR